MKDGSCDGSYTVNATPLAGSGIGGSTPPLTTVTTYIRFPEGTFFFGNAGVGVYAVTVTKTSGCAPPKNVVELLVEIEERPAAPVDAVANQEVCPGDETEAVHFTSTTPGAMFYWTNDNPSIGLAAEGMGDIPSFTAINPGNTPQVATITVTPAYSSSGCLCKGTPIQFTITVDDSAPPVISDIEASPLVLTRPNHKMVDVTVNYSVTDYGPVETNLSVSSNEAVDAVGSGNTAPDWKIVNDNLVRLRAEHVGKGNGRIYTIAITSTDRCGNTSEESVQVLVPKGKMPALFTPTIEVTAMPNPTENYFNVSVESDNTKEVIIINILTSDGKVMETRKALSGEVFRIGYGYNKGVYFIQVIQGPSVKQIKLIKH